jgi:hypothetical protein
MDTLHLIDYFANAITSEECFNRMGITPTPEKEQVLALTQREWDNFSMDEQGEITDELEERLDEFFENLLKNLLNG